MKIQIDVPKLSLNVRELPEGVLVVIMEESTSPYLRVRIGNDIFGPSSYDGIWRRQAGSPQRYADFRAVASVAASKVRE